MPVKRAWIVLLAAGMALVLACEAKAPPEKPRTAIDDFFDAVKEEEPEAFKEIEAAVRATNGNPFARRQAGVDAALHMEKLALERLAYAGTDLLRERMDLKIVQLDENMAKDPASCLAIPRGEQLRGVQDEAQIERQIRLMANLMRVEKRAVDTATKEQLEEVHAAFRAEHPEHVEAIVLIGRGGFIRREKLQAVCDSIRAQWSYVRNLPEDKVGPILRAALAAIP
jgi:hypothetical protein